VNFFLKLLFHTINSDKTTPLAVTHFWAAPEVSAKNLFGFSMPGAKAPGRPGRRAAAVAVAAGRPARISHCGYVISHGFSLTLQNHLA
jgi:hypothetical protein